MRRCRWDGPDRAAGDQRTTHVDRTAANDRAREPAGGGHDEGGNDDDRHAGGCHAGGCNDDDCHDEGRHDDV